MEPSISRPVLIINSFPCWPRSMRTSLERWVGLCCCKVIWITFSLQLCVICLQLWQGRWQGDEIIVKVLQVRDWTTRKSRDFNEEHPKLRYISKKSDFRRILENVGIFKDYRQTHSVHEQGRMLRNVVTLQLSSADEDFHTCSGTFCHVLIGFFLIQTFCLFSGPVSHLHPLTPSSLLTTCHMDRSSTYSTKALVSRFMLMYQINPVLTLSSQLSFALCFYFELKPESLKGVIVIYTAFYQ